MEETRALLDTPIVIIHFSLGFNTASWSSSRAHLEDGDDDTEEADGAAEYLNDEDLHEEVRVLGVGEGRARTHDPHADTTEQVGEADRQPGTEHGIACNRGGGITAGNSL